MTTYRVGAAGATVFGTDGKVLCRLRPGTVVVEGTVETAGSLADQYKRLSGYADKAVRPGQYEDKS